MADIDGRVDEEKLIELLDHKEESTRLEFKEKIDLMDTHQRLCFVKDIVSMQNNYPGGYIIVGIRDDGTPPEEDPNIQWELFDTCKLQDKVRPYVAKIPKIASKVHSIDNHKYCLISVQSIPDGLPLPFEKDGNDQNSKSIFNKGDIFRRNGPQNERISHNDWNEILAPFADMISAKEREMIDAVINRSVDTLIGKNETIQLSFGMPEESFISTLTQLFENEKEKTIDVFLTKIKNRGQRKFKTLSLLISIGVYAAFYENHGIYSRVISILYNFYRKEDKLSTDYPKRLVEYLTCIYALGSACVRNERLGWAREVIDNEGDGEEGFRFRSWIRACQVLAVRVGTQDSKKDSTVLSYIRKEILDNHLLALDLEESDPERTEELPKNDALLDSLCSFDMLYCIYIAAQSVDEKNSSPFSKFHERESFPSCSYYYGHRVKSTIQHLLQNNGEALRQLLPQKETEEIERALKKFENYSTRQASVVGNFGWIDGRPNIYKEFCAKCY